MALKKGVCKNYGNCPLADKEEIQEVDSSEFFCKYDGKPLYEVPPPRPPSGWIYIVIASIILIGGGVGLYFGFFIDSNHSDNPNYVVSLSLNKKTLTLDTGDCETLITTVTTTPKELSETVSLSFTLDDSSVAQVDNAGVVCAVGNGVTIITVVASSPKGASDTAKVRVWVNEKRSSSIDTIDAPTHNTDLKVRNTKMYSFGKYVGELKNGIPEGDGKMFYYCRIQIAKHDTDNPPHYAEAGDWFEGTWGNGDIMSGALYNKKGIIKEKIFAPKRFNSYDLQKEQCK